ncbi:MAG: ABC transporter ATP-binding protein [Dehalococcoidia bacterium]|nr:ABC transporter ATP-binding protein [Dehalococcoidia bacterium]
MSIEVRDLCFSYGNRTVLDGVNVTAQPGELLSVIGPNGVGKSTLFHCILGLYSNYRGSILIGGHDIRGLSIQQRARLIAYVPQSNYPSFNFSVSDMVLMGTSSHISSISTPGKKQLLLVEEALDQLGIAHLRDRAYTRISGGERQLTIIARALAQQTKVLILDEPVANLDFGNQLLVLTQIKKLAHLGYTVMQATHNPDQTFMFSDSVLALKDGHVLACGAPTDVATEDLMQKLYATDIEVASLYNDNVRICVPKVVINNSYSPEKVTENTLMEGLEYEMM